MSGLVCGIDPGLEGAISFYDPLLGWLATEPLPTRWKLIGKNKRFEIDRPALLAKLKTMNPSKVVCEEPQAMPGMGATSSFSFGVTCGSIYAVLESYKYEAEKYGQSVQILYVFPAVWKVYMKVPSDKNRARAMAGQLFPEHVEQFKLKQDEGCAEAALLAWYGVNVKDIKQKERTAYVKGRRKPTHKTKRDTKADS